MSDSRHEGDSWDPASSVGATATLAATGRAIASRADRPLSTDPFAEPLVRAVGVDLLTRLASGEEAPGELLDPMWIDGAAVRAGFYDEYFLDATQAGIAQVVILASGLDSRAYRLPWPGGTVLYEVDRPPVLEFKTRTLAGLGAEPTAERRVAAADLREDWAGVLRAAGFDPSLPTAWSAEGLLGYLPPEAQDRLLDTVTELSAPGSRIATENRPNQRAGEENRTKRGLDRISELWRAHGFELDHARLRYFGARNEAAPYLARRGWVLHGVGIRELFTANGLPFDGDELGTDGVRYIRGVLG
ncbi:SAM-dependent methyltransferase [Sciscionella sediminilitoris]|uniref:SAM-dependent methyltransferase n=1 Tax=Sciscionella sediminilitoris TaxID=1445613 RepID=UPI0004DF86B0|nr:class I SAM-dependent methyltransferase [Sciscionella sp. SE31]